MNNELIGPIKDQIEATKKFIVVLTKNDWTNTDYMIEKTEGSSDGSSSALMEEYYDGEDESETKKRERKKRASIRLAFELYKQENKIVTSVIKKRNQILKGTKGFHDNKYVVEFYTVSQNILDIHYTRIQEYIESEKSDDMPEEIKREEVDFMMAVNDGSFALRFMSNEETLDTDFESGSIRLHENTPMAQLFMYKSFLKEHPEIQTKLDEMGIDLDPEVDSKVHLYNVNAPQWNPRRHFFDQEPETLQYYLRELKKCKVGITLGGVFIEPWLYFHLNYFQTLIPTEKEINGVMTNEDIIREPPLRDNEWFIIQDVYPDAQKANKIMFIAATRRFSKSTLIASHLHWKIVIGARRELIASSTSDDLGHITANMKTSMSNINRAFYAYTLNTDWEKEVILGARYKSNTKLEVCNIRIVNMDGGAELSSEKLAGFTPDAFVIDEIMKSKFKKSLEAAIPAIQSAHGWRCVPFLSGCLTAGNKVYTREGKRINIEDLKYEDGIIGYNKNTYKYSPEGISHINPPQSKECVKIKTRSGIEIECSTDHPFLVKRRSVTESYTNIEGEKKRRRKLVWVEAKDLIYTDQVIFPEEVPLTGTKIMQDPYFIGLLIGDGNYSGDRGARLSNEDPEVWEYVNSIGKDYKITKEYTTKKGLQYKEVTFRGGMKFLKDLGIYGQSGVRKDLPENIEMYREEDIIELLRGLFDADGYVTSAGDKNNMVGLTSSSRIMLDNVQSLLLRLGIYSQIVFQKPDNRDRKIRTKNGYYKLLISRSKAVRIFYEKIGFKISRKNEVLKTAVYNLSKLGDKEDTSYPNIIFDSITEIAPVGMKPVYNLTTDTTHTYLANGVVTHNTGGNGNLAEDAFSMLKNPEANQVLQMDWDKFNQRVPKEYRTWGEQKFGTFAPAQMSQKTGMIKLKSNLADYLGVDNEELRQIEILVTDWKNAKEIVEKDRESKRSERISYIKEVVYFPLSPEEIFMSDKVSPFPVDAAREHLAQIRINMDTGRKVRVYNNGEGIQFKDTNDPLPEFPHSGGNIDSPIVLFDEVPENPPMDLYVSSLDDYKQESSGSSSLGCFYVMKRQSGNDPMGNCIVATLTSRPDPHKKLHRDGYALIKAFNAMCLMENEDMEFKVYLDYLKETDRWLVPTFDLKGNLTVQSNSHRKYGISPKGNRSQIIAAAARYCNEEVDIPDGRGGVRQGLGVERIKDELLLEEIINYNEDLNVDRITAFGIALIQMHYLDTNFRMVPVLRTEGERKTERPKIRKAGSVFGSKRLGGTSAFERLKRRNN